MKAILAVLPVLLLAACNAPPAPVAAEPEPAAATPAPQPAAGDDASREPMQHFRAFGNEPFWSVEVNGNTLVFTTPDDQAGQSLTGTRSAFAKGLEITGTHADKPFALVVKGGECSDGMSDNSYDQIATFEIEGRTLTGCAELKD